MRILFSVALVCWSLSAASQNNFEKYFSDKVLRFDFMLAGIRKENPAETTVSKIYYAGDPHLCVDLAFIEEGYKADEMEKFREDVRKMADVLFSEAPFSDYKNRINIWAVEAVSSESGTDPLTAEGKNLHRDSQRIHRRATEI